MFDKLKNMTEMMKKAKMVKDALGDIRVDGSSRDGKIKISFDGESMAQSVNISEEYLSPDKKGDLERELLNCLKDGIKKSQAEAAKKMKEVMGVDLPGIF